MENPSLISPKNPHFFQPLFPGFKSHIKIPLNFFSKHIKGKHEGKTVKLRSDSSTMIWKVKMEGNRLTDGWKKFVEAHNLRIGDFVVFRHEGDVLFHVTALGPSCCEIQYTPSRSHEDHDDESGEIGESSRKEKEIEENVKTESDQFSSDLTCFSQSLTASNLSRDSVGVPRDFAKRNGLNKGRQEIVLMNEEGKSWESEVKGYMSGQVFIVGGWTSFCTENKLEVGDSCTFKLLHNRKTPVFRLCSRKKAGTNRFVKLTPTTPSNRKKAGTNRFVKLTPTPSNRKKAGTNRFVKLTPTPSSLDRGKQHLPASFTRVNMLKKPGEIILVDKNKVERSMKLRVYKGRRLMYIISRNGWKTFCAANGVGPGDSLTLELIRGGTSPLLKFVSHTEQLPFEVEAPSLKNARVQRWDWESRPKHDVRKKIAEEGGPSRCTRSSNKSTGDQGKLQHTQFGSILDHVAKVKQSVEDTLTSIRRFQAKLETKEHNLEALLQNIEN